MLEVSNVAVLFGATPVLRGVSFQAAHSEIVCLLGPSGCGKTTMLRVIAGLQPADAGKVLFAGRNLAEIPVHQRGFGFMFQEYALFPHRNVYDNVAFGLRMASLEKAAIRRRVAEMLDLVGLTGYEQRHAHQLSGGQQQRVALARSLAPQPALLLLDEPLGSLDRTLREELMGELRRILKQAPSGPGSSGSATSIYVTHDQQEAFAIADRVVIMNAGRIEQEGPPLAVYRQPANVFVARFLGMHNLTPGRVVATAPEVLVDTPLGVLRCAGSQSDPEPGDRVLVLARPDAASLVADDGGSGENLVLGLVREVSFRGSQLKLTMEAAEGARLMFELPGSAADALPEPGQPVRLALSFDGLSVLPENRGENMRSGEI